MEKSELIRLRAYEIWVREGQPEGRELEHWLLARRDILGTMAEQRDETLSIPDDVALENIQESEKIKAATELG